MQADIDPDHLASYHAGLIRTHFKKMVLIMRGKKPLWRSPRISGAELENLRDEFTNRVIASSVHNICNGKRIEDPSLQLYDLLDEKGYV